MLAVHGARGFLAGALVHCSLLLPLTAAADQPGAMPEAHREHQHGSATLDVRIDGERLVLELKGSATDLAGFEHPPATAAETGQLARALDVLREGNSLFLTPAGAQCRLRSAAVSPPTFTAASPASGNPGQHSDLAAAWEFRCGNPAALEWLEARVFTAFPRIRMLATTVASARGSKTVVLTPGTSRVLMPR